MRNSVLVLVAAVLSLAQGYVSGYHIEPVKASWSGWTTLQNNYVSQSVTCNFDSLSYVELFAGDSGSTGSGYRVGVLEGGVELTHADGVQHQPASWIRFENWSDTVAFTKGKLLEFRFTRSGQDSIQFYWAEGDKYPWGGLMRAEVPYAGQDLAMRCYARMDAVDSAWWGYQTWAGGDTHQLTLRGVPARAESAGVGMARIWLRWADIWPKKDSAFRFANSDAEVAYARQTMGCEVIGLLAYTNTAEWASSRLDSLLAHGPDTTKHWSEVCPPRNLFAPETSDTNYWYRYVRGVVAHYNNIIDVWEIWNEPNDTVTFWKVPNLHYTIGSDTVHDMCSLYARLCDVAVSAIDSVARGDTVLVGSLCCLQAGVESRMDPIEMLSYCYQYGQGGWDGVAAHHYSNSDIGFIPAAFEAYAESLRAVMRGNGDYGGLWLTETGWPVATEAWSDTSAPARYLCKAFTMAAGTNALPQGGYDRIAYYSFRGDTLFGILDTADTPRAAFYAACQAVKTLTRKRFNGRVMTGDARDDSVRMYEFEDPATLKRTWVCWQNPPPIAPPPTVAVKLPARSDTTLAAALAYNNAPPSYDKPAAANGWLPCTLTARPVFVTEPNDRPISRPDLVVDSVKYVPPPSDTAVLAWVTNRGNRATPCQSPGNQPYPTWAVLYANGDSLTQRVYTDSIAVNQQVTFRFSLDIAQPAAVLLAVKVNPAQTYVELGTDDNSGYRLKTQP